MVTRPLSAKAAQAVAAAVGQAERETSAEIVLVVAPASDPYYAYTLLTGYFAGSVAAALTAAVMPAVPLLIFVKLVMSLQLVGMGSASFVPALRRASIRFVPQALRLRRAHGRACEEYVQQAAGLSPEVPLVMLYVGVAERTARLLAARGVRAKVGEPALADVLEAFTAAMDAGNIETACIQAAARLGELLAPHFPAGAGGHEAHNLVQLS